MKWKLFLICLALMIVVGCAVDVEDADAVVDIYGAYAAPRTLAGATNLTPSGGMVNVGSEIRTEKFSKLTLYVTRTPNFATDMRLRVVGRHTSGGTDYVFPILTTSSSSIAVEDQYLTFTDNLTESTVLSFDTNEGVPYIQVQGQGTHTAYTTPATFEIKYSQSYE